MDEFGMNFHLPFFKHKEGWYFKVCFSYVCRVWIYSKEWLNFEACFSYVYGVWIYSKKWLNFEACFSYVYGVWIYGKEWLNFKAWFSYVCRVWIYGKEWLNFKVFFSYIYGVNFLQKLDDSYCIIYLCYWSTSINYGPLASIINPPNYTLNLIKINNHNRSCILIEVTVEAGSRSTI